MIGCVCRLHDMTYDLGEKNPVVYVRMCEGRYSTLLCSPRTDDG